MKQIPENFAVIFQQNPKGGRPIAKFSGIVVMPENLTSWNPPLGVEVEVRLWSTFASGRSRVLYVAPV